MWSTCGVEIMVKCGLCGKAEKAGDKSASPILQWFYNEQIEEEEQTMKVRDKLKMVGDATNALLMLDSKLGKRE